MVINRTIVKELEHTYRRHLSDNLKRYLLVKYADEPFPYEYSEHDLYASIHEDIRHYELGKLDVTVKSLAERWKEERSYLQNLYIEKAYEACELEDYIAELEHILSEHGLESSKMSERRIENEAGPTF